MIDVFSKYEWVIALKDELSITIINALEIILDDSKRKPNKIWVDKGSKFYNNSFKKMVKRQWYRNVFNTQWWKICCCWNIY